MLSVTLMEIRTGIISTTVVSKEEIAVGYYFFSVR